MTRFASALFPDRSAVTISRWPRTAAFRLRYMRFVVERYRQTFPEIADQVSYNVRF